MSSRGVNQPGGVTDADREILRRLSNGEVKPRVAEIMEGIDPDSDESLEFPWRLDDGRSGVTLEMCNATRCAAADGLSYSHIAELFTFLCDDSHARRHATGECRHEGVPPVDNGREPGPPEGTISKRECREIRRKYRDGVFDTYAEAGESIGRSMSRAWRHINGDCPHDQREEGH